MVNPIRYRALRGKDGQGGHTKGKKRDLFKARCTLLKGCEKLADWEKKKLDNLFCHYPELKMAWTLKEAFRSWHVETSKRKAEQLLDLLKDKIVNAGPAEFKRLLGTLDNWREEILNYFDYHITNGFVEGKNNLIKTIKRRAYGYRNINNFRLRILANQGTEVSLSHLLT